MRSEVFYELDPRFLLFPQFQVTVDGCSNEEISPVTRVSVRVGLRTPKTHLVMTQKFSASRCMKD